MMSSRLFATLILLALSSQLVHAQPFSSGNVPEDDDAPHAMAAQVADAPVLDGTVLGEAIWEQAQAIQGFWQTRPDEGQPASENTVVRIIYTETTMYVGVVCYHEDPSSIIVSEAVRDGSLEEVDSFRFILDTYRDSQNGFVFGTSPAGIEYDAQITNEGQGAFGFSGAASGSMGGFNINWDGSWDVATATGDYGWSAEFAIPFSTLRFPRSDEQTWGINFQRNIRHRNEQSFWVKLERQYNLMKVSLAGTLGGLRIPDPRNLKIMPFVLGQTSVDYIGNGGGEDGEIGLDAKYSITPSLALDLTVNTDFAQVEVDEQQVNLDRFSLFFPEKRPFFLENAGLFSINSQGSAIIGSEVELFFSRRIGIGSDGTTIPIIGGARVSGNVAGVNVGFLNMQTREVGEVAETNNFGVVRVERELKNRSALGVMFVNREGNNAFGGGAENRYNRVIAVDGKLGLGEASEITSYVAKSISPHLENSDDIAFDLSASYNSPGWILSSQYVQIGENFNPEVGFLARRAFRKFQGLVFHRIRPQNMGNLLEIRPHISYRGYWGVNDDFYETGFLHVDSHWEWRSGFEVHTGINFKTEGVRFEFPLSDKITVPAGTYDWAEAQLVGMTNAAHWISFSTRAFIGGYFGGNRVSASSALNVRAGDKFNAEFTLQRNNLDLPSGDDVINLFRTRVRYSFTPRIFLQGLTQYNDRAEVWSMNWRFGWLQSANTGLFLVFNQSNAFDLDDESRFLFYSFGDTRNRSLTLKYTYLFDVFK